ncbi:hypothetical protein MCQ_01509 [Candidatus Bartonella washoeensis Sb944nv]|uniref:Uncharacterized protein n=1 Tax=Candidatus Bartonella washoeensis Sb944nv TaxID=1094563 RepID=J1J0K3_9HYPH|nr:DUF1376 domain-containing protein [Bartonella washoeensis]EJF77522.1 hypothetical protein MCQ_01509 [Bartonella washoeensis Sb944nv]
MSTKLAWVRCFPSDWVSDASGMTSHQISTYMMLTLLMYKKRQPLLENASILARISGCSVKAFNKALDFLLSDERLIRLEDGRLWSLQVEEELNNSNENLNKFSERAQKAAQARWKKHHQAKIISDDQDDKNAKHDANGMLKDAKHNAKHDACDAITNNTNNTNIYNKKTNTIVLAKKEIGSESLETDDQVHEPTEVHACESPPDQIATSSGNQPPIDEQENVPKKARRVRSDRGCRLPEDFKPNLQYAIDKGLTHDEAMLAAERFANFWLAKSGKDATKDDWQRTWYNWVTHPELGPVAQKKAKLEQEKQYGKPRIERTGQQRGWNYRVAQHMSNVKNSDSVYKFLFEDNERTTIPLESGAKTIDCRSGEGYLIGP